MYRSVSRALMLCLPLVAQGCDDLELNDENDRDAARAGTETGATGSSSGSRNGTGGGTEAPRDLTVDATDRSPTVWSYVDLDTGAQDKNEAAVAGWDIAIQRSSIKLKPGTRANVVANASFDGLTESPSDGWGEDAAGEPPKYLLSTGDTGWYDYDGTTHVLTPRALVYIVQTDVGYQKLQIVSWTNDAGTTAVYHLKIGKIAGPKGPTTERDAEVDVSTSASRATDAGTSGN